MSLVKKVMMWSAIAIAVIMVSPAYAADKVSFMLDWYPNPDHAPIYVAQQKGYFADQGITLDIMVPADPNDPLKLVAAGKVDLAISYQPSVTMARSEGLPVVSIGSLVQHPLSSILYLKSSGIKTPADFKGKKIGYSVEPLYRVLFEAVAEKAGLKKTDYEAYSVGFNLVPPLLAGKIDAAVGAFRNVEAIQVELEGHPAGVFAFEDYGVPDFYELVIIANPDTLKKHPQVIASFMKALTKGINDIEANPEASLADFLKALPDLNDDLNKKSFMATVPFFKGCPHQDPARWTALQTFMLDRGLIEKATPVDEMMVVVGE